MATASARSAADYELKLAFPLALFFLAFFVAPLLLLISVSGLGTGNAAFVWVFAQAGVPAADAFALSILFLALGLIGNLPGGVMYVLAPRRASA